MLTYLNSSQDGELQNESLLLLGKMAQAEEDYESALVQYSLVKKQEGSLFFYQANENNPPIYTKRTDYYDSSEQVIKTVKILSNDSRLYPYYIKEIHYREKDILQKIEYIPGKLAKEKGVRTLAKYRLDKDYCFRQTAEYLPAFSGQSKKKPSIRTWLPGCFLLIKEPRSPNRLLLRKHR